MTQKFDFDLFVIGGGSGGVSCARRSALHGAKVALCEEYRVGGTCVIRGCVPKKLLMYAGKFKEAFSDAISYGWDLKDMPINDWTKLITNVQNEVSRLNGIYINMLDKSGVELIEGHGKIISEHEVQVGDQIYTAEKILIATGGTPWTPEFDGYGQCLTSNDIFEFETLPKEIVIIGGGYIAVEFACILNNLGANITQVIRSGNLLNGFDHETRCKLEEHVIRDGVDLIKHSNPKSLKKNGERFELTLDTGQILNTDCVISATGRKPNIWNLGIEELGIQTGKADAILVNEYSQTNIESIYAVGDVTNIAPLTPVAIKFGRALAENLFNGKDLKVDLTSMPTAVFSDPAMSTVGLSQEQAIEKGLSIDIYRESFRHMKYTIPKVEKKTFMKLIVDHDSQKVLGAQMIGDDGPEIMQLLGVAISAGATKSDFDNTIALHPSAAEEFVLMSECKTIRP